MVLTKYTTENTDTVLTESYRKLKISSDPTNAYFNRDVWRQIILIGFYLKVKGLIEEAVFNGYYGITVNLNELSKEEITINNPSEFSKWKDINMKNYIGYAVEDKRGIDMDLIATLCNEGYKVEYLGSDGGIVVKF